MQEGGKMPKQQFLTADIETYDGLEGNKFAVGCIYNGKTVYTFTDCTEFIETLLRYEYPRYRIFFHNAMFDLRFILQYCLERKIEFPAPIIRGGTYLMQEIPSVKKGAFTRFQDSYALIPVALGKFTKIFSLQDEKVKMAFDGTDTLDDFKKRCATDVKILYDGLEKFFSILPTARTSISLSQSAMKDFITEAPNFKFTTKRDGKEIIVNEDLEQTARMGYFGGRNECFNYSDFESVYYYDINSLYPYVMLNNLYPVSIHKAEGKNVLKEQLYYVKATVELPYMYIPPLPSKLNKLYFTYGKVNGWFYSPEFRLIEGIADRIQIHQAYAFTPSKLFKEFVSKYWAIRQQYQQEGNELQKVVKLYLNSLYGKFGQKREIENREYLFDIAEGCEELSDGVYTKTTTDYSKATFINPFISGFITSYARAELFKNLSENSIYCDTDSIVSTKQLRNVGKELGQFKLEGKGRFKAFAPKTYFFLTDKGEVKNKSKGVYREKISMGTTPEIFIESIKETKMRIFAKPKESIRRYGNFLAVKDVVKRLNLVNDKRIVLDNLDTKPYTYKAILCR